MIILNYKVLLKTTLIGFHFLFCAVALHAQEFAIRKLELDGERVNVYYDLIDSTASRTYTINLYSSLDNFTSPLLKVSGALGLEVKPGLNQKIVWNAKEEIGDFDGRVGLEVRGKAYIPFIRLKGFEDQTKRRRGVKFDVLWTGGRVSSLLNFELYRNGKFVAAPQTNIAASLGKTVITIPTSVRLGKNYQFKITDSKNKDDIVFTEKFQIKAHYPGFLKLGLVGAGAAAVYFILNNTANDEPDIIDPLVPTKGK